MYQIHEKLVPPHLLPHFGVMKSVFEDEELDRIKFFEKILDFQPAMTLGQTHDPENNDPEVHDYRNNKVGYMTVDQNTEWLWQKISHLIAKANYDLFLYDIEFIEAINYLIYEEGNEYKEHRDCTPLGYRKYDRKISGIVMLSDPDEYEGGDLEVNIAANTFEKVEMQKGDVAFFDSWFTHRVNPITKGTRRTLAFWAHGINKL